MAPSAPQAPLELGPGSHPALRALRAAGETAAKQGPDRWATVCEDASKGQLSAAWGSRGEAVGCVGTEGRRGKGRDEGGLTRRGAGENAADAPQTP